MAETGTPITGIKEIVYAVMTGGDTSTSTVPTYGTVKSLFKVNQFGFDPAPSQVVGYFDDQSAYVFYSEGEKTITLSGDRLLTAVRAEIYGKTTANGIVQHGANDIPPYIAIGGKYTRGDGSSDYFWFPKVQLASSAMTADTKAATINPQMESITGRILNLTYNGSWFELLNTANASANATTIANWFTAPVYTTGQDLGAVTVTAAAGTAGKIVFTFTKAGGGNITLDQTTFTASNIFVSIDSTGVLVTPTWVFGTGGAGVTQTATASGFTAVKHDYVVTAGVKDVSSVGCTPKAGSVTVV
jgi:phi13 family phage major tail protein